MFLKDPHAVVSECGQYEETDLHKSIREIFSENSMTTKKSYELGKLDALNEIKEEISNYIVHSPYFHTTRECCGVRDDVRQIFDKHITKIEEVEDNG